MKKLLKFIMIFIIFSIYIYTQSQLVISYIDGGLLENKNYELKNLSLSGNLVGTNASGLDAILDYNYASHKNFIKNEDYYEYNFTTKENYLLLPFNRNILNTTKKGQFLLAITETINNDFVRKILIDEEFTLPAKAIVLQEELGNFGNTFTYSENSINTQEHFRAYKKQEYLIRISYEGGNKAYDIYNKTNPLRLVETYENDFLNKNIDYIDFIFSGDDYGSIQEQIGAYGLSVNFIPSKIHVGGFPNGNYNLQLYSRRYSSHLENKGYIVVTLEDEINFIAKDISDDKRLIITNLYEGEHKNIKVEGISITDIKNPQISLSETYNGSTLGIVASINLEPLSTFYKDKDTVLNLDSQGYDIISAKYYQKFTINYSSPFENKDNIKRKLSISSTDSSGTSIVQEEYYVTWNTLGEITSFPHQTIIARFTNPINFGTSPFEIIDNAMSKYTFGYRAVKYLEGAGIENIMKGLYANKLELNFNSNNYLWEGNSSNQENLMINKAISDSRGIYTSNNKNYLEFYTNTNIRNFTYEEENNTDKDEKATFLWNDSERNTHGVIISDDKIIFRISKIDSGNSLISKEYFVNNKKYTVDLPKYYIDLYKNENPIGNFIEKEAIAEFIAGTRPYVDLIFNKGEDREVESGNSIFLFSKDNSFRVIGLPRGNYQLQMYTLKNPDLETQKNPSLDYKTFTYEAYKNFEVGLPTLATGDFAKKNNLFMIENINVYSSFDNENNIPIKNIQVNFVTKAQRLLNIKWENLIASNLEEGGSAHSLSGHNLGEWHESNKLEPLLSAQIGASEQASFQFPLDIVFLVDNSGSMRPYIQAVKDELKVFTDTLIQRGFDIKYNLITFGTPQHPIRDFWGRNVGNPVGAWHGKLSSLHDRITREEIRQSFGLNWSRYFPENGDYIAIYKDKWFDGKELQNPNAYPLSERPLQEFIYALDEINDIYGYPAGPENGAWALYYGAEHLKKYGRYLDFNNKIVENYRDGYIPSQKWIIFLTDENFAEWRIDKLPNINNYQAFLNYLSNMLRDYGIRITGLYNVRDPQDTGVVLDDIGNTGLIPADTGGRSYNEIRNVIGTEMFNRYEMGLNGRFIKGALNYATEGTAIIQRWKLNYTSPFNASDGLRREVIFSLRGFKDVNGSDINILPFIRDYNRDRYYRVPEERIEAYFINPDPNNVVLTKEKNLIKLEVMARSQYYELDNDGNTTLTNYKIQKGLFIVRGSGKELALSSDYDEVKISLFANGWYKLEAFLDANEFEDKFANNNFYIEATASTRENSKTISLAGVQVGEFNPPLITEIKLSNNSLFESLKLLKDEFGNRVFDDNEAFNLSSISYTNPLGINMAELNTYFSYNKNKLAFKLGDEISYSIKVEDESIRRVNGSFVNIGDSLASLSLLNDKYEGKAKVNTNNSFIQIHIEDDYGNTSTLVNSSGNTANLPLLYRPAILNTSVFPNNLYFSSKSTESPLLDRALLETTNLLEDAIAYLFVFEYDIEKSDAFVYDDIPVFTNTYNVLEDKIHWLGAKENKFLLLDGEYKYSKVFALNRAMEVYSNEEFEDSLIKIMDELNTLDEKISFRVDNVAPRLVSTNYNKSLDSNNISITGLNVPIKNLDEIEFLFKVEDINLGDIILLENTSELLNFENTINNDLDEINSKIRILYNQINENKILNSEFQISDLAGNILVINPSISYDSRLPSRLTTVGEIISDNNIKFSKDTNYKLDKQGLGQDIAYASIKNNFAKIDSLPISISKFNFQGIENMNNIIDITTYSSSGIKLGPNMEQIVIDTRINGGSIPSVKSNSADGVRHRVPISFNQIQELVGLKGFRVITPNITVIGGNLLDGYYPLTGANYNTVAGTSSYDESYFLEFTRDIPGEYTIQIELIDRLGNKGTFNFIVQITRIVELRGKVEGSDLEIKSIIEIDEKLDIKSRTK